MPPGARYVGRGTRWGNPYRAYDTSAPERAITGALFANLLASRASHPHSDHLMPYPSDVEIRRELAGLDLACRCPLPEPGQPDHCHAAVLLQLANSAAAEVTR
jgi:hypothetical protein